MKLFFILKIEKNNNKKGYFPNCSLGNWKKLFFPFAVAKAGFKSK